MSFVGWPILREDNGANAQEEASVCVDQESRHEEVQYRRMRRRFHYETYVPLSGQGVHFDVFFVRWKLLLRMTLFCPRSSFVGKESRPTRC
jgi:hypothetical protein